MLSVPGPLGQGPPEPGDRSLEARSLRKGQRPRGRRQQSSAGTRLRLSPARACGWGMEARTGTLKWALLGTVFGLPGTPRPRAVSLGSPRGRQRDGRRKPRWAGEGCEFRAVAPISVHSAEMRKLSRLPQEGEAERGREHGEGQREGLIRHTNTCIHRHTCTPTQTCVHRCTHACTHRCTQMHTDMHI